MRPVAMAVQGKGLLGMMQRAKVITRNYGLSPARMDIILRDFVAILRHFNCAATFPITAIALARSKGVIEKYQADNIEFAVHGYYHIDHSQLSLQQQIVQLEKTRHLFRERGMPGDGFRSPYLRWNSDTLAAVVQNGFLYDSSQALFWDVVGQSETESYHQVLGFYRALSTHNYPALPYFDGTVVRIPYCLPDDEALVDRLHFDESSPQNPWLDILSETTRLGELFTLGLHPERIYACKKWLSEVLQQAQKSVPSVWMTRLDDVARWWRARLQSEICITQNGQSSYRLSANGPDGLTILTRGVKVLSPASNWDDSYQVIEGTTLLFEADQRPFIAISQDSDPRLAAFLCQQGYIVETAESSTEHSLFLRRSYFGPEDERSLLAEIERGTFPLVRLGRWPNRAKSALVVTGDVDALTIWDYGLRIIGA